MATFLLTFHIYMLCMEIRATKLSRLRSHHDITYSLPEAYHLEDTELHLEHCRNPLVCLSTQQSVSGNLYSLHATNCRNTSKYKGLCSCLAWDCNARGTLDRAFCYVYLL